MQYGKLLSKEYDLLQTELGISEEIIHKDMYRLIRKAIHSFCEKKENPAIWCLGMHTRMMMADFMNELKKVKVIIDRNKYQLSNTGFKIIRPEDIKNNHIDGIIISSYLYREEIKRELEKNSGVDVLDIYEYLDTKGVRLYTSYYSLGHPYNKYRHINKTLRQYNHIDDIFQKEKLLEDLVKQFVLIKDFRMAFFYIKTLYDLKGTSKVLDILKHIKKIYELELKAAESISSKNVVMLCMDGLRRKDVLNHKAPHLLKWLNDKTQFFTNAYSVSTSTYESLIPTYSENSDLRSHYYEKNIISEQECRFICKAVEQKRDIRFYTDTDSYIESKNILKSGKAQTATEKIWDFIYDACATENGLFYLHILYETHYSYPNPYSTHEIVADGSNIMFDFMPTKGGILRTDYVQQQMDALRYVDDTIVPFLEKIACKVVLYADHGNILLNKEDKIEDLEALKYSCHDDLVQIPLAIKANNIDCKNDDTITSLMNLNQIICNLLEDKNIYLLKKKFIKVQRSPIYNPDFSYIYKQMGKQQELEAFELFIFDDGYHLVIYANGVKRLFKDNQFIDDKIKLNEYYRLVTQYITVIDNG